MKSSKIIAVLTLTVCMIGNLTISAFAAETAPEQTTQVNENAYLTEKFYNASNDTIVCYMEGVPIRKDQVNEYGLVDASAFVAGTTRGAGVPSSNYVTIPAGYNEAIVKHIYLLLAMDRQIQSII